MRLYLLILATLFSISVFAQTGPGGVGNSSNNFLWLKVDDLSGFSDGDRISQWTDASGNSNHLSSSGTVRPYFRSNIQNTFPAVSFETPNNRLVKDNFASFPTSEITFIVLNRNDGQSGDGMVSYASSSAVDNDFMYYDSDNLKMYVSQNTTTSSLSVNDNNWHIIDGSWQSSGGNMEFWIDGNQDYTSTLSGGQSITANGCLSIGAEQDSPNGGYVSSQTHNGQFLEVIGYNMALNSAQRVILANYLANKYNLSVSNDRYAYDFAYAHDLAGIGRYNSSNTHTEAQSAGMLKLSAPSGMNSDNEYLLFAHDDAGVSSWTTTNTPANVQRISREWRFDETGSMGTVSVTVDNSSLPALSGNYTKWGIMVDNDGDFSSGAEIYELAASGSDYVANNVDINDGDYVTIVSIDPYIEFETVAGSALEDSDASATISINYISSGNTSVDYSTVAGSATSGDDYTAVSGNTATISAGDRQTTISINVVDDSDAEPGETFKIQLSNPSTGVSLGANDEFTHTIYDNDNSRKVSFDASASSATESVTNVSLAVSLSAADNTSNTYVDYDITGGTAETADYSFSSGKLTFDPEVTTATIDFSIINDNTDEYDQTIVISLSNPQNCNLQSPSAHTYTIEDDDVAPDIEFASTSSSATENNASRSIGISLSAASEKDIQVDIASSGSATLNTDYSIPSPVFEIKAGNSTGNFTLNIFDDNDIETNETVVLSMSSPVNAGLGTNDQHTHTIENDDIIGYEGPGGVGKSEYVKLWTRAEDIPGLNDGDRIATWDDISGNSNNLSQPDNSFRPAYYSGVVNGFPVARFDQDKNRLVHNSFDDFPTGEITTIFVNKNNNSNMDGIISYASSANLNDYLLINSSDLTVYRSNHNTNSGLNIADNNFNIVTSTWNTSD
ncbi:MAG: hypothetical protein K9I29_09425, partial [Bacteroidales bacterium]|nr:hypothetical protein [Bacteroidales bacterium]